MVELERHISKDELAKLIQEETDSRINDRLNFIQHLYHGNEIPEAAGKVGYGTTTGYNWIHAWNDDGVEGLVPNFGGDRPPKLTSEQEERFTTILAEDAPWTTAEVYELLAEEFSVEYSERHLRRKRESDGMPESPDYRRPDDADKIKDGDSDEEELMD